MEGKVDTSCCYSYKTQKPNLVAVATNGHLMPPAAMTDLFVSQLNCASTVELFYVQYRTKKQLVRTARLLSR